MTDLSLPAGMIDVRGLTQAYGDKRVLDDVNLSVAEHERCALAVS